MQQLITKLIAHIISSISLCPYQSIDHISPCMSPSLLSHLTHSEINKTG